MPEYFKFYNPISDKWFYALASDIAFDGQTWGAPADKLIPAELFELQQQLAEAEAELAEMPELSVEDILERAHQFDTYLASRDLRVAKVASIRVEIEKWQ